MARSAASLSFGGIYTNSELLGILGELLGMLGASWDLSGMRRGRASRPLEERERALREETLIGEEAIRDGITQVNFLIIPF